MKYSIAVLMILGLIGCGGGGGGDGASAETPLAVCSMAPELDTATRHAVALWRDDTAPPVPSRGLFSAAVTIAHELGHALANRIDHLTDQSSLMHGKHNPHQAEITDADLVYVDHKTSLVFTQNMSECAVVVRWGDMGAENACPATATGCFVDDTITLSVTKRWAL